MSFEVPDQALATLRRAPDASASDVRLAVAMYWCGRGDVTMATAAAIAGLDLRAFLATLAEHGRDAFVVDLDDLDDALAFLAGERGQAGARG